MNFPWFATNQKPQEQEREFEQFVSTHLNTTAHLIRRVDRLTEENARLIRRVEAEETIRKENYID